MCVCLYESDIDEVVLFSSWCFGVCVRGRVLLLFGSVVTMRTMSVSLTFA